MNYGISGLVSESESPFIAYINEQKSESKSP
jgi:hypothetical protein